MIEKGKVTQNKASSDVPPGTHIPSHVVAKHHDISVALLNAMILPGLGQYYNGQVAKAIMLMLLEGAVLVLTLFSIRLHNKAYLIGGLGIFVLGWLMASIDAALIANRIIRQRSVRPWQWF